MPASTSSDSRSTPQIIAFMGGGQMASALAGGLLGAGWPRAQIQMVEPDAARREWLRTTLGLNALAQADATLRSADVVVWAVKPQIMQGAIASAKQHLGPALHISIAAGVRTDDLARWLGSRRVVRAMPNTAALVASGVTGMRALDDVPDADRALVAQILSATGYCFWVDSDERLDAVTAISGSGPAYVFHFLESFQRAAEALGFAPEQAREMALRTAEGAVRQAVDGGVDFGTLRERVTSRRGTTESALNVLNERETPAALMAATQAAYARAAELSAEFAALGAQPA